MMFRRDVVTIGSRIGIDAVAQHYCIVLQSYAEMKNYCSYTRIGFYPAIITKGFP